MNSEELKEKIRLAKEAVEGEKDPYKTEAFKVILGKLIESSTTSDYKPKQDASTKKEIKEEENQEKKLEEFAKKCSITLNELNDILSIKKDTVEIIVPVVGSDAKKNLVGVQIILAAHELIFGDEWVPSSIITECLRSLGVKDLANLSATLKKYPDLFRLKGGRRYKEYKLTSGQGRISAFEIIRKLAKGELNEN